MRADRLAKLLPNFEFDVIDTNIPYLSTNKLTQSIGFRYKRGPLITKINQYIKRQLSGSYDVIWMDKGIFISGSLIKYLRNSTQTLIHFTPDTAFLGNRSHLFELCIPYYDHLITTKSFEQDHYQAYAPNSLVLTTQGFDPDVHKPYYNFKDKIRDVVFIGLCEPYRQTLIKRLIEAGITVSIGGKKWDQFYSANSSYKNLEYLGDNIYGKAYAELISSSKMALGLLSREFPELHTTRTFEIPACKTALVTEKNPETEKFYNDDEVIFYNNDNELLQIIPSMLEDPERLETISQNGYDKVHADDYSYNKILQSLIDKCIKR